MITLRLLGGDGAKGQEETFGQHGNPVIISVYRVVDEKDTMVFATSRLRDANEKRDMLSRKYPNHRFYVIS